jgi:hypothetical protein
MDVYIAQHSTTVNNAPVGLLIVEGAGILICKSKFRDDTKECECIIIETGDKFIGGGETVCRPAIVM